MNPTQNKTLAGGTLAGGTLAGGTLAYVATQCDCPDSGTNGTFLFTGKSHKTPGSRVSPVLADSYALYQWIHQNNWLPIHGRGRVYAFQTIPENLQIEELPKPDTLSFQHGKLFIESVKTPNTPYYLQCYTPPKMQTQRQWRIVEELTGRVVDAYTPPPPPKRPKCQSRYIGSWAWQLEQDRLKRAA